MHGGGAMDPGKKGNKLEKMGWIFSCIRVIRIIFFAIFNKELHALEGFTSVSLT